MSERNDNNDNNNKHVVGSNNDNDGDRALVEANDNVTRPTEKVNKKKKMEEVLVEKAVAVSDEFDLFHSPPQHHHLGGEVRSSSLLRSKQGMMLPRDISVGNGSTRSLHSTSSEPFSVGASQLLRRRSSDDGQKQQQQQQSASTSGTRTRISPHQHQHPTTTTTTAPSERPDHLQLLIHKRQATTRFVQHDIWHDSDNFGSSMHGLSTTKNMDPSAATTVTGQETGRDGVGYDETDEEESRAITTTTSGIAKVKNDESFRDEDVGGGGASSSRGGLVVPNPVVVGAAAAAAVGNAGVTIHDSKTGVSVELQDSSGIKDDGKYGHEDGTITAAGTTTAAAAAASSSSPPARTRSLGRGQFSSFGARPLLSFRSSLPLELKNQIRHEMKFLSELGIAMKEFQYMFRNWNKVVGSGVIPVEVRMQHFTYQVHHPPTTAGRRIKTVYNSSILYILSKWFQRHICVNFWNNRRLQRRQRRQQMLQRTSQRGAATIGAASTVLTRSSLHQNNMNGDDSGSNSRSNHANPSAEPDRHPRRAMTQAVLKDISLTLQPGKMYLILGPPASGKTSLLKALAGRLAPAKNTSIQGEVLYNGEAISTRPKYRRNRVHIENAVSMIQQLDFHAPRMTVQETFQFAFECKAVTHAPKPTFPSDTFPPFTAEQKAYIRKLDEDQTRVKLNMTSLGLDTVADTFVGNATVRGVSGGQRRRVTVGEMMIHHTSVSCGDEISTGLDAASTYDICYVLLYLTRALKLTRIISLLQPSPECVALFDEVILLSEGYLLFAGPIEDVEDYFAGLGYRAPDQMDVADFLQVLGTDDGQDLYHPELDTYRNKSLQKQLEEEAPLDNMGTEQLTALSTSMALSASVMEESLKLQAYSMAQLALAFRDSSYYSVIEESQKKPTRYKWTNEKGELINRVSKRFAIPFSKQVWLNLCRNLLLWRRDKRFLIANAAKNFIMGISVGGVFFQTDSVVSILGVLFQITLFIMLGAMVSVPSMVDDRIIFYKHHDANFYAALPYVIGNALALLPQSLIDVMIFGTIIYWMVGLTASLVNYAIFISILFCFALVMNQMLAIFAAVARTKTEVQGASAVTLLFLVLFCGFIVNPDVIPNYYSWIFWWNPLAWSYRAMLVNEFQSEDWSAPLEGTNYTIGEQALINSGFSDRNGEAYRVEWIGWNFAYQVPYIILCIFFQAIGLVFVRHDSETVSSPPNSSRHDENRDEEMGQAAVDASTRIPVPKPVTLTFQNVCYDVQSSTGKGQIRLLHDVNGVFRSGRMCALMGSSGAGKTTLMDVIALRKNSGTISGEICVNGFPQDPLTFRRCAGYVEQFDVQAPQLTVRETCMFSARLRLNSNDPAVSTDEKKRDFVFHILDMLELSSISDCLVGDEEEGGGLSFEQRKRLSIAVEMSASPSILFLDEPTSGLDARAALLVCKILRAVANSGRTVIATIHQPSLAVFELFDDLLLLKKGGRTVYFGQLGANCSTLVNYFESKGAEPIDKGENPANWMLKVITADDPPVDYGEEFPNTREYEAMVTDVGLIHEERDPASAIKFETVFAASRRVRNLEMNRRLQTIYWRSPAYNLSRMLIAAGIAFILGSVFVGNRYPENFTETEMSSILSTIFISFIIMGVLSITSVLPVMLKIRDSYYRHEASGMLNPMSLALALGVAEKWFLVMMGVAFTLTFIGTAGLHLFDVGKDIAFFGFFTFNIAIYSYFGQFFMCVVRSTSTAQILASVFIGLNNFFSGLIVRPQYMTGFFQLTYWITPGHYVYEGMTTALFWNDDRRVIANEGSDFYFDLIDKGYCVEGEECKGPVWEFIDSFFGGRFTRRHVPMNAWILGGYVIIARVCTYFALKKFKYTST